MNFYVLDEESKALVTQMLDISLKIDGIKNIEAVNQILKNMNFSETRSKRTEVKE